MKQIELLAPAGSYEALVAAVENGADAVYFGSSLFNARMMAKNFSREEIARAVAFCHERGVFCYVTMNTAITDRQMKDALNQVQFLYEAGVDALIIADLGLASEIHKSLPDFPIHASTQCSAHNLDGVTFLKALGFSRVVVARELDKENLRSICQNAPIEIEAFVHGALCVSQSGQCLFSSFLGGRSGNRGECAQPCRMMYNGKYPLSLKDLSLAEHITELVDMGVASLKIEGRMKSPDYVGRVVRIFRRLLDEGRNATKDEMASLAEIFSRSGFTDGYFEKRISPSMLGVRTERDLAATRRAEKQDGTYQNNREPITIPERVNQVTLRAAPIGKKGKAKSSARFYNPACIPADYQSRGVEIAYLPLALFQKGVANGVVLPPVIFDSERAGVLEALRNAVKNGASHALVGNVGHIALAKEAGLLLHGDYRLNITSSYTAAVFDEIMEDITLSPELILPQVRDIRFTKNLIVYGRQILMTLEKPVGAPSLTDRTKAVFPILKEGGREILVNSVPTYMADRKAELAKAGEMGYHFLFTTEGKQETLSILTSYEKGWTTKKAVRRIK